MPVLPIIDLLILTGWTSILVGGVLKAIYVTTSYRPTFLGLAPLDLLLVAVTALLFALALAARTWVKANEPRVLAQRRLVEAQGAAQAVAKAEEGAGQAPGGGQSLGTAVVSDRAVGR